MEPSKITETYVYLGLAEIIIAVVLWPLKKCLGFEGTVPTISTEDGIWLNKSDRKEKGLSATAPTVPTAPTSGFTTCTCRFVELDPSAAMGIVICQKIGGTDGFHFFSRTRQR